MWEWVYVVESCECEDCSWAVTRGLGDEPRDRDTCVGKSPWTGVDNSSGGFYEVIALGDDRCCYVAYLDDSDWAEWTSVEYACGECELPELEYWAWCVDGCHTRACLCGKAAECDVGGGVSWAVGIVCDTIEICVVECDCWTVEEATCSTLEVAAAIDSEP